MCLVLHKIAHLASKGIQFDNRDTMRLAHRARRRRHVSEQRNISIGRFSPVSRRRKRETVRGIVRVELRYWLRRIFARMVCDQELRLGFVFGLELWIGD